MASDEAMLLSKEAPAYYTKNYSQIDVKPKTYAFPKEPVKNKKPKEGQELNEVKEDDSKFIVGPATYNASDSYKNT